MPTIDALLTEAYTHWDDPGVLARTGRDLQDRNRLDHARRILRRAVELRPADVDSWAQLSFAYFRSFQADEGLAVLREGLAATDSDGLRVTLAGFTEDEAERKTLQEAIGRSDDPGIRASLVSKRYREGDDKALDELMEMARERPDDYDVRETLTWALFGAKQRVEGLDLREVGVPLSDRTIAERPDSPVGHWMKAHMLLMEKDHDAALEATAAGLARMPDEETLWQLRGRAFREKGDHARAAHCFGRAIGIKPSFVGARVDLGRTYEAMERPDLAEEIFREIPVANPGYTMGPISLALFFARQDRLEEAEPIFLETWPKLEDWQQQSLRQHPDAKALLDREAVRAVME